MSSLVKNHALNEPPLCWQRSSAGSMGEELHGKTGLISNESSELLAQSISRTLQDRKFRYPCGKNARDTFEQLYKRAVIDHWQKLLSALTTVRKSGKC
jgi:hypothetical protein